MTGVAYLLVEAGVEDVDVLQAALLHDTVEDTATSPQELQEAFGPRVAGLVAEVGELVRMVKGQLGVSGMGRKDWGEKKRI